MNFGLATERAKGGVELDPMVAFRQGVELLKNEYPQKAMVKLRLAFERDQHNPYFISFLGLSIARAQRKWDKAAPRIETAWEIAGIETNGGRNPGNERGSRPPWVHEANSK